MASAQFAQIGHFKVFVLEKLGKGGFGTVYKAKDRRGQDVAAKEINMEDHPDEAAQEAANFYKLKPIKHQNIVEILDVQEIKSKRDKKIWIFMELCPLGDLNKYFREHSRDVQADSSKLNLMTQIAEGIEFLHLSSIIHRDIKPANILVSVQGSRHEVVAKLADFGLTKFLDPNASMSYMSTNQGTLVFMAPEFWKLDERGAIRYKSSVDIFAAGLVFLAIVQPIKGKHLLPTVENDVDRIDIQSLRMPIGQAMLMRERDRKAEVRIVENRHDDSSMIKALKRLIKQMTCVKPDYRITASQVQVQLQVIHKPKHQVLVLLNFYV